MKNAMYFTAKNCAPCLMFKPIVQEVTTQLGVPLNQIDVYQSRDLAEQYSVTGVPTLIVFEDGQQVHRNTGVLSKQQLQSILG